MTNNANHLNLGLTFNERYREYGTDVFTSVDGSKQVGPAGWSPSRNDDRVIRQRGRQGYHEERKIRRILGPLICSSLPVDPSDAVISRFHFYYALRPRGIGLIRLPFGVSDHRSGPYLPNLYIAGNKLYHRTQSVPDVSLPGQDKDFSGHAQFNPFTHMTGVASNLDFGDSWGAGYALQGVNFLGLDLRRHYRQYAQMPHLFTDGMHQPFQNSFIVGAEVDSSKYVSHAVALDIPIPGLNEVFDFQEETLMKRDEELIDIHHTRFSLPIPSTDQRLPFKAHSFERFNDIDLNFAQVLPSINNHNIKTDDIVDELITNRANPGLVG